LEILKKKCDKQKLKKKRGNEGRKTEHKVFCEFIVKDAGALLEGVGGGRGQCTHTHTHIQ